MAEFDPDKYLQEPFDPESYLGGKRSTDLLPMDEISMQFGRAEPEPQPSTMPYREQMYNVGQFGKGVAKGAAAGVPGMIGDIETLGRAGARLAGAKVEPKSVFPTTERILERVAGPAETKAEAAGRAVGPFASPLPTTAVSKLFRRGAETLVGPTTRATETAASRAENLGFKLEPRQLRADQPYGSPGFGAAAEKNQTLANKLASKETGVEVGEITPKFVGERLKTLGNEYDKIFANPIKADRSLVQALENIATFEARVRPAESRIASQTAMNIVDRFNRATQQVGPTVKAVAVDGKELQRLREEISYLARTATQGSDRTQAGEILRLIDDAISRTNPQLGQKLAETNKQYAATSALRDMIEQGGIQQGNISLEKLGNYLAQNVYGFGSGTSRHPLLELGTLGRELNIRARWQGLEAPSETLSALLSRTGRLLTTPLRTQLGRRVQRGEPLTPPIVAPAVVPAAGGRAVEEQ